MKTPKDFIPAPGSLWLVVYECRANVVRVAPDGRGFFAPGQEPLWEFSAVTEWVAEVRLPREYAPALAPVLATLPAPGKPWFKQPAADPVSCSGGGPSSWAECPCCGNGAFTLRGDQKETVRSCDGCGRVLRAARVNGFILAVEAVLEPLPWEGGKP